MKKEFVPCHLYLETRYPTNILFDFELDENYPFFEPGDTTVFREIELTPWQFNALPCGNNVSLYAEIGTFKEVNPLPEVPPPWPEAEHFYRCSMCGINLYFMLYP